MRSTKRVWCEDCCMKGYVPITELQGLLESMHRLSEQNRQDIERYENKGLTHLSDMTEGFKFTTDMWAKDVEKIINKYGKGDDYEESTAECN